MLCNKVLGRTKTDSRVVQLARLLVDEFDKALDVGSGEFLGTTTTNAELVKIPTGAKSATGS